MNDYISRLRELKIPGAGINRTIMILSGATFLLGVALFPFTFLTKLIPMCVFGGCLLYNIGYVIKSGQTKKYLFYIVYESIILLMLIVACFWMYKINNK